MCGHSLRFISLGCSCRVCVFLFTDPAPTEIYTLSLHDALPISACTRGGSTWDWDEPRAPTRPRCARIVVGSEPGDRKSTRLNSSHVAISYAVFCLKKKKKKEIRSPSETTQCDTVGDVVMRLLAA